MTEIIQSYKFSLGRVAVCLLLLLTGAVNVAKSQQEIAVGRRIAREMRGGEEHTYQVTLSAGQYARVALEQQGIDVVLALFGVDGKPIVEVDNNLSGTRGLEVVSLVVDVSGAYRLNVRSLEKGASAGRYEVWIEELRPAPETVRSRVAAGR